MPGARKVAALDAPTRVATSAPSVSMAKAIDAVRDLAWAGQHAQAVERCSQELAATNLAPAQQMELRSLRSESLIAQGRFADAAVDAAAMLELARVHKHSRLRAEALQCEALVRMAGAQLSRVSWVVTSSCSWLAIAHTRVNELNPQEA